MTGLIFGIVCISRIGQAIMDSGTKLDTSEMKKTTVENFIFLA